MNKVSLVLALALGIAGSMAAANGGMKAAVALSFYSQQLSITFNTDMLNARCAKVEEKAILDFYRQLERTDYHTLLDNLKQQQHELLLNDWLFFQLLRRSIGEIYSQKTPLEQELVSWFLLSQAGFDTRLTYLDQRVFVYVYSREEVFEVPMIEENNRTYVNLTSLQNGAKPGTLYLLNFAPRPKGRAFSFALEQMPRLQARPATSQVNFYFRGTQYLLEVQYDQTLVDLMKKYPLISEAQYLQFPMSPLLEASLLPQLKKMLQDKTPRQALELLVGFTRSSFAYKEDREHFGRSKPMIADELFYYPFSDCEDRSALFYDLVRKLLDLPMVVIAYPNHITVGVALDETARGAFVEVEGKPYFICDPTGPINSTAIGIFPEEYATMPYEVVVKYK